MRRCRGTLISWRKDSRGIAISVLYLVAIAANAEAFFQENRKAINQRSKLFLGAQGNQEEVETVLRGIALLREDFVRGGNILLDSLLRGGVRVKRESAPPAIVPAPCLERRQKCKRKNSTCWNAYTAVKNKCKTKNARCVAEPGDIKSCVENIDLLRSDRFWTSVKCGCSPDLSLKKSIKCSNARNRIYSNPCYEMSASVGVDGNTQTTTTTTSQYSTTVFVASESTTAMPIRDVTSSGEGADSGRMAKATVAKQPTEEELLNFDKSFAFDQRREGKSRRRQGQTRLRQRPRVEPDPVTTAASFGIFTTNDVVTWPTQNATEQNAYRPRSSMTLQIVCIVVGVLVIVMLLIGVVVLRKRVFSKSADKKGNYTSGKQSREDRSDATLMSGCPHDNGIATGPL